MQTTTRAARPGAERKRPDRRPKKQAQPKKAGPQIAQQTIPYREIFKDGICRVNDKLYTKSMEYEDINYQLAQADDQSAIFDGYCAFLNSFDSSLPFQLSFINHRSRPESKYKLNIPTQDDEYSEMRSEYVEMLEGQIAKSNNGIVRTKLLTFGVSADSLAAAKPRLERVEADITGNFKKLGGTVPAPLWAGTAGDPSRPAPPRRRGAFPLYMGYDTQDRNGDKGFYRPHQL